MVSKISKHFATQLQEFVYQRTYARYLHDKGRRETWEETVERTVDYLGKYGKGALDLSEYKEIREAILNHEVYPSMRLLWSAGESAERNHISIYNCSAIPIDSVNSFATVMYVLIHGTGIGFSVENQYVSQLPVIEKEKKDAGKITVVLADTKEGWAWGVKEVIERLYEGYDVDWDLSKIRPKGAILKVSGGRASGPEPLDNCLSFIKKVIVGHRGRKLSPINAADIVSKIAESVVVGGSRRSAMIALSDLDDQKMAHAKDGAFWETNMQRAMFNSSAVYTSKPSSVEFMREWLTLSSSGTGERGLFNREACIKSMPARRDSNHNWLTNPCVTGDTLLLTKNGQIPIGSLVSKPVEIWNGEEWSEVTPFSTGVNPIWEVQLSNGTTLKTTAYHKFVIHDGYDRKKENGKDKEVARHKGVEAQDLRAGDKLGKFSMPVVDPIEQDQKSHSTDAYSQGFYSGDGVRCQERSYLYSPKYVCADRLCGEVRIDGDGSRDRKRWIHGSMLPKDFVPMNESLDYRLNWFAGLLDSDGCVTRDKNGNGLQIVSVDLKFLRDVQQMLVGMGVQAKVVGANKEGIRIMPDGRGGMTGYECKKSERLLVGNQDTASLMALGLNCSRLDISPDYPQRDARRFVTVTSVKSLGYAQETYCVTEPIANRMTVNGVVTFQCAEIMLRPYQFCNLTSVIIRENDTLESLKRKVAIATKIGTIQATMKNFGKLSELNPAWDENADENLLGVSLNGMADNQPVLTPENLKALKKEAKNTNEELAKRMHEKPSKSITCVKPEGSTSLTANCSSGIHPRISKFYLRRIRISGTDPLFHMMRDQGVKFVPEVGQNEDNATIWVCEFPVKSPDNALIADEVSAIDQLNQWLKLKRHWAEHTVSCTVYVNEEEWMEVGNFVYKNFDDITGVSFLPKSEHVYQLAPLEPISESDYYRLLDEQVELDFSKLPEFEKVDMTTGAQQLACVAGQCEI